MVVKSVLYTMFAHLGVKSELLLSGAGPSHFLMIFLTFASVGPHSRKQNHRHINQKVAKEMEFEVLTHKPFQNRTRDLFNEAMGPPSPASRFQQWTDVARNPTGSNTFFPPVHPHNN